MLSKAVAHSYSVFQVGCPSTTPTEQRMRLTLLDLQPIFSCFGDLSSTIMAVSGKVKASHSIRAPFGGFISQFSIQNDRYVLSKTAIRDRFEAQI